MATTNDFFKTAKSGRASDILRMLEDGTSVDARNVQGDTALMLASYFGNVPVARMLLEHGAKTNVQNNTGQTALMYACNRKHTEIVRLLLRYNADSSIADESGRDSYQWIPGADKEYLRALIAETEESKSRLRRYTLDTDTESVLRTEPFEESIELTEFEESVETSAEEPPAIPDPEPDRSGYYDLGPKPVTDYAKLNGIDEPGTIFTKTETVSVAVDTGSLELEEDKPFTDITPQAANILVKSLKKDEPESLNAPSKMTLPPISAIPEKREEMQILHAVRMNWLRWLGRPFVFIWKGIVWLFLYFWSLVVIAWRAMVESFRLKYWLYAAAGIAVTALLSGAMWLVGSIIHVKYLLYIASGVGLLPLMWAAGEITAQVCCRIESAAAETVSETMSRANNGLRVMTFFLLFVLFQAFAGGIMIGFNLTQRIPEVGGVVQSVLIIPALLIAGFLVFNTITIAFSSAVLPGHLLHYEKSEASGFGNLVSLFRSLLGVIRRKWLRIILILPWALLFGALSSVPVILLAGACVAIAGGGMLFNGTASLTSIDFQGLAANFMSSISGWKGITSAVMMILAGSAVLGCVFSVLLTNLTVSYYFLYKEVRKPVIRKGS